jgi:hypothetical protein
LPRIEKLINRCNSKIITKMKSKTFVVGLFAFFALALLLSLASAVTVSPSSFSQSTNPSDDVTSRTLTLNFNITNTNTSSSTTIALATSSLSSWTPVLSKTSDSLAPNATNTYTLTLTAPKFSSSSVLGSIDITEGGVTTSVPVSLSLNSFTSLRLTPNPVILTKGIRSTSVTLKNDGNQVISGITVSVTNGTIRDSDGETLDVFVSNSGPHSLNPGANVTLNVSYDEDAEDIDLLLGDSSGTLTASSSSASASSTIRFTNDYCEEGEMGSDVDIISVEDETSGNGNFDWELLEDVELEIEVANNGDDDEDVTVQILIYDTSSGDELYEDEQTALIDEDDEETFTFNFVLPADTPDNARLYVKAFYDGDEDEQCTNHWGSSKFEPISIEDREEFDIGLTDIELESTMLCGSTENVKVEVHNIGEEDQDRVLVSIFNSELGIDEEILVSNLDSGDSDEIDFQISIPQGADEKLYQLEFEARHDYNRRNDNYDEVTDKVLKSFTVEGSCVDGPSSGSIVVSPTLESEAIAGKELVIKARVTNNGAAGTVSVIPFGYESWAVLKSVEPSSVTLASGESKDVTIKLTPNSDSQGEQRFTIRASMGSTISDQETSVFLTGKSSFVDSIKENWVIWAIVIANIILIVAIIIAAVKLSNRE